MARLILLFFFGFVFLILFLFYFLLLGKVNRAEFFTHGTLLDTETGIFGFDDEGIVLDIQNFAVDTAIGNYSHPFGNILSKLLLFLLTLDLRTEEKEIHYNYNQQYR